MEVAAEPGAYEEMLRVVEACAARIRWRLRPQSKRRLLNGRFPLSCFWLLYSILGDGIFLGQAARSSVAKTCMIRPLIHPLKPYHPLHAQLGLSQARFRTSDSFRV